jgi:uncharacterized protein (TIGR02284 family)
MDERDILDVLNTLIVTCGDGELGLRRCAKQARSIALRSFLDARAGEWARAAEELRLIGQQCGGAPRDLERGGSPGGAVRRGWMALRGAFVAPDDRAALALCARGEEVALERYREALDEPLPEPLRARIEQQYLGVLRNHALARRERGREPVAEGS